MTTRDKAWASLILVVLIAACLWRSGPHAPSAPPVVPVVKPTAVTYVYEKDDNAVPSPVRAALSELNKTGILATEFEDDTVDGTGETPDQYKVPLVAAKEAGLPSLVATAGAKVVRVVKAPTTAAQVLEAAK